MRTLVQYAFAGGEQAVLCFLSIEAFGKLLYEIDAEFNILPRAEHAEVEVANKSFGRRIPWRLCHETPSLRPLENLRIHCSFWQDQIQSPADTPVKRFPAYLYVNVILKEPA